MGGRPIVTKSNKNANAANAQKARHLARQKHKTKKGNPSSNLRQRIFSGTALSEEKELSKVIGQSSEQKVAAKLIQAGHGLSTVKDLHNKGKEMNRERRRKEVKKHVGRTESKLNDLKAKEALRDQ